MFKVITGHVVTNLQGYTCMCMCNTYLCTYVDVPTSSSPRAETPPMVNQSITYAVVASCRKIEMINKRKRDCPVTTSAPVSNTALNRWVTETQQGALATNIEARIQIFGESWFWTLIRVGSSRGFKFESSQQTPPLGGCYKA